MSSPPQRLRLLLYLEWMLLAIIAIAEGAQGLNILPRWPILNGIGLALFAVMGIRLPQRKLTKLLYIASEVSLLLVTGLLGGLRLVGFWFVVIVMRNSQFLRRHHRIIVTVVAFALFVFLQFYRRQAVSGLLWIDISEDQMRRLWVGWMVVYGLMLIFLQLLLDTILAELHGRQQLSEANDRIRQYANQIEALATSQERNRIAREIHDGLGHSLTALNVHLEAVRKLWSADPVEAQLLLEEAQHLAKNSLKDVRESVSTLRSDPLSNQSLEAAIASLGEDLQRSGTLEVQTTIAINQPIVAPVKIAAYRIVQEALTNIMRHANASSVSLQVQTNDYLQVDIWDNGEGFEPSQNSTGLGLQSMEERALAQGGTCKIITAPGKGCRVQVSLPLSPELATGDLQ